MVSEPKAGPAASCLAHLLLGSLLFNQHEWLSASYVPEGYPWPSLISLHPTLSSASALSLTPCSLKSTGVVSLTQRTFGSSPAIQIMGYKRKDRSYSGGLS